MPNDYTKELPCFSGNNSISIEGYLDVFWWYMESQGAEDEDVFMHSLGAALDGDAKLWFNHFEPRTITGYDMFTDLLKKKWGKNIDKSIEEQSGDDCVDENQFEEDRQDNDDELTNDCPYQIDFFSFEPTVNVPLIELLSGPSIRENVIELLKNSHDDAPISDYDLNINLEEFIVSSSP